MDILIAVLCIIEIILLAFLVLGVIGMSITASMKQKETELAFATPHDSTCKGCPTCGSR